MPLQPMYPDLLVAVRRAVEQDVSVALAGPERRWRSHKMTAGNSADHTLQS